MYREVQEPIELNIIFDDGGLGDSIARLPAIKYINDLHKHVTINLWVPDYFFELAYFSLENCENVFIHKFTDAKENFDSTLSCRAFSYIPYTNLATHLTDHAFNVLCNTNVDSVYKDYLLINTDDVDIIKFNLPQNYAIMTTGYTANVRHLYSKYINEINDFLIANNITPVFLGKNETPTGSKHIIKGTFDNDLDLTKGVDLINKTTLLESSKIIKNSKMIIGLDNGLLHLAAASSSEIPIVGGFTTVHPKHRMPYRNKILGYNYFSVIPKLDCRFCQSNWTFTFKHDFKECFHNDYLCCEKLYTNLWIEQIERSLLC